MSTSKFLIKLFSKQRTQTKNNPIKQNRRLLVKKLNKNCRVLRFPGSASRIAERVEIPRDLSRYAGTGTHLHGGLAKLLILRLFVNKYFFLHNILQNKFFKSFQIFCKRLRFRNKPLHFFQWFYTKRLI